MKTLFRSSISSSASNRRKGNRPDTRRLSYDVQSEASDLVGLVREPSLVFGFGSVNNLCAAVDNFQPAPMFTACAPVRALIKQMVAATGLQCRDDCFFNAVYRMNKVNFTRREILEEVSPRLTIHPSIERTVSSHE